MGLLRSIMVRALMICCVTAFATGSQAVIFDDGNDRQVLFDLRLKPESELTQLERLTLEAADRYGNIGLCSRRGGNATLIDYFGRPAVITSGHMVYDEKTGKQKCTDAEMRNAIFMPNVSYFDDRGTYPESFTHRRVKLVTPPARWDEQVRIRWTDDDVAIFYLEEDITKDIMPSGRQRGAMIVATVGQNKFPVGIPPGKMVMIGVAPDIKRGVGVLYQNCRYSIVRFGGGTLHDCDTVAGSSGSAMLVEQNEDLRLLAVHASESGIYDGAVALPSDDIVKWNRASTLPDLSQDDVLPDMYRAFVRPFQGAELIPYQLQFLLFRAGCYSGALDNKWGPGSRKALAEFVRQSGATLPGNEPTRELWDALEAAVKNHERPCR